MQEAVLYKKLNSGKVKCLACNWYCEISDSKTGICSVRGNKDGKLYLLTYGKVTAVHIDPVEKKPLFHFLPGTEIFSIGTFGCNFGCEFCQNWSISQASKSTNKDFDKVKKFIDKSSRELPVSEVINICRERNIPSIAYTYNEPTIFSEYAYDIAKEAKKYNIKNVYVSNGFLSKETLDFMGKCLDGINIDLKAFREETYRKICKAKLPEVLDTIKEVARRKIWVEITTLVVHGLNDSEEELKQIANFIASVGKDIPWHVTAFHPDYKMTDRNSTPIKTLEMAHDIGIKTGLRYVYTGNVPGMDYESTYCPNCHELLIKRWGMSVEENRLEKGKCSKCGTKIAGIWV